MDESKKFLFCSLVLQNKDTSKAKIITFSSSLLPYLHFIYPVPYISATILQLVVLLLRYINNHETYIHTYIHPISLILSNQIRMEQKYMIIQNQLYTFKIMFNTNSIQCLLP